MSVGLLALLFAGITLWVWWVKQFPIVSGEIESLMIWDQPPTRSTRTGQDIAKTEPGSRVKVYEGFILVVTPKGERIVSPHGYYDHLKLKKWR